MLDIVCTLLLIGRLCVADSNSSEIDVAARLQWPVAGATLRADEWQAEVIWATDNIQALNPLRMPKHCEGASCVEYFRHCEEDECYIVLPGDPEPLSIRIRARSPKGMERAMVSLYYLSRRGDESSIVYLGALATDSTFDDPYCGRRPPADGALLWDKGCEFLSD